MDLLEDSLNDIRGIDRLEGIKRKYEPKIIELLTELGNRISKEKGVICDSVIDVSMEEYEWGMQCLVTPRHGSEYKDQQVIGNWVWVFSIKISEEAIFEGEGEGINFLFELTNPEGRDQYTLFLNNFTEKCWGRTHEEIEAKWKEFQKTINLEMEDIVKEILEY